METPYYLIHRNLLDENIAEFKTALNSNWENSQLCYSVKTNSLPWLLKHLNNNDVFAEVVSDEEYYLAQKCGFKENHIIFNGPIKSEKLLKAAILKGSIVNLDSALDVSVLLSMNVTDISNVGIRINVPTDIFSADDVEYYDDGFRFGFAVENGEFENVLGKIRQKFGAVPFGIHLHCNTKTRSLNVYKAIAGYSIELIKKYNFTPSYIDIGGGFWGGVSGKPSANDYMATISAELAHTVNPSTTKLLIEPGSAIIASSTELHTSVLDVKKTNRATIITTDGSRILIDPLWRRKSYLYTMQTANTSITQKQIICGYTCMDHDRIMCIENDKELSVGDKLIYHRVGAYTMTFSGMFIRHLPEVYVIENSQIKKVRNKISNDTYYKLHANENV